MGLEIFSASRWMTLVIASHVVLGGTGKLWSDESVTYSIASVETDAAKVSPVGPPISVVVNEDVVVAGAGSETESEALDVVFGDWLGYDSTRSQTTWLAGGDFGMFSCESFPTLDLDQDSAVVMGTGFHFLDGPLSPSDMPPRLFDLQLGYHGRKAFSSQTMLDVKFGVGVFSDFEGSARKGVRFPGHAVAYHEWNHRCVSLFGVDVLDRDDISLLPVAGFVLRPQKDLVFELVFPRPRVNLQLNENRAMYIGGELGGGTWAIERDRRTNDNVTYRDLRVTWGVMDFGKSADSVLEIGWAFDRSMRYRSAVGNRDFDGALILRCHTHY